MRTIYQVKYVDAVDGMGPGKTFGFFLDKDEAHEAARGRSSWGHDGSVYEHTLYDSVAECEADKRPRRGGGW